MVPLMTAADSIIVNINSKKVTCQANTPIHTLCPSDTIVCSVNGILTDITNTVTQDCTIVPHTFDSEQGRHVFWHSCAHVLGAATLQYMPSAKLASGPPTDNGFYYDVQTDRPLNESDMQAIEKIAQEIISKKDDFVRVWMSKENVLDLYKDNKFKQHYIHQSIDRNKTAGVQSGTDAFSCYKTGNFIDFCNGPHVNNTRVIRSFKITKVGGSYFLGDRSKEELQRVYGIAFPDKKREKEYYHFIEEGKKRNHRVLGQKYDLFHFSELSPGSVFFIEGTVMYNRLMAFLRREYKRRGYTEVITPNMFMTKLWETSGHLENYRDDMFVLSIDGREWALKPMNCPGHCLIYSRSARSYRELPIRLADFGVLHRNELTGTLSGLTRMRRFQQDDAHIFCAPEQIRQEILGCLSFMQYVYGVFGFSFELTLSTRPSKYLGTIQQWDAAEEHLRNALQMFGHSYAINEGDGAFYGPKIDVILLDALKRRHQCATIQLDFQLPIRFNLQYTTANGTGMPVMVHRALLGSIERFMAILIESYGANLPFWLLPRQIAIVVVVPRKENDNESSSDKNTDGFANVTDYVKYLVDQLIDYEVKVFDSDLTLNKRIRNAETEGYGIVLVIGAREMKDRSVVIRKGNVRMSVDKLKDVLSRGMNEYVRDIYEIIKDYQ